MKYTYIKRTGVIDFLNSRKALNDGVRCSKTIYTIGIEVSPLNSTFFRLSLLISHQLIRYESNRGHFIPIVGAEKRGAC